MFIKTNMSNIDKTISIEIDIIKTIILELSKTKNGLWDVDCEYNRKERLAIDSAIETIEKHLK